MLPSLFLAANIHIVLFLHFSVFPCIFHFFPFFHIHHLLLHILTIIFHFLLFTTPIFSIFFSQNLISPPFLFFFVNFLFFFFTPSFCPFHQSKCSFSLPFVSFEPASFPFYSKKFTIPPTPLSNSSFTTKLNSISFSSPLL